MVTISLCIVSRNEAENLRGLLESIKSIVNEVIYVDTGSKDESLKIAEEFNCKVYRYEQKEGEWIEDARNLALSGATSEWILALDADERISASDFFKIRKLTENTEYIGYYLIQRHYNNNLGVVGWKSSLGDKYPESKIASGWHENPILRLFINDKRIKYKGKPHDLVDESVKTIGKICLTDIPIHHFGELNRENLGKFDRNIKLLEPHLENPDNKEKFFTYYQIACEYIGKEDFENAENNLKKSLELKEDYFSSLFSLGSLYIKQKKLDLAEKFLLKAAGIQQTTEIYNNLGIVYSEKKEFNRAIKKFEKAIELNEKSADANFNLGLTYLRLGKENKAKPYFEKAVELNPAYRNRVRFN